jgi:hypothetical protein
MEYLKLLNRLYFSCNNVAPVTNLCLGRATTWSHSSQWSKKKIAVETSGVGYKRLTSQQDQSAKKKPKKSNNGNERNDDSGMI